MKSASPKNGLKRPPAARAAVRTGRPRPAAAAPRRRRALDPWPVVILAGAAVLRTALILGFRSAVSFDEPHYLRLAGSFLERGFSGLLHPYWPPFFPLVIAVFKPLTGNLEAAGRLVNVASSCLTVWLVMRMARGLFGRTESLIAAGFAAFYPPVAFVSTGVMPEPLFSALALAGIWLGWRSLAGPPSDDGGGRATGRFGAGFAARNGLGAGLCWGAAYLVRPEGVGFPMVYAGAAAVAWIAGPRPARRRTTRIIAAAAPAAAGFLLLAAPYWNYLHGVTGKWTLSTKGSVNQQFESAVYFADKADPDPFYHLTADNRCLPYDMAYHFGNLRDLPSAAGGASRMKAIPAAETAKKFAKNFYHIQKQVIPELFSTLLLMLFAAGLLGGPAGARRWGFAAYGFSFMAFFWLAVIPLFHVNERYFLPLFPLAFPWIGRGAVFMTERIAQFLSGSLPGRFRRPAASTAAAAAIVACVVLVFGVLPETARIAGLRADAAGAWADPVELKEAGQWLRREAGRPPVLMSLNKAVDYYAGQNDMRLGASFSYDDIGRNLAYARNRGVEYVVFSSRTLFWFPNLAPLIEKRDLPGGLRPVYESDRPAGIRTVIYRVEPVAAAETGQGAGR
jgi:4-amino-4-deoxy-L-arabinose transferase-like glycosyltransferase